MNHELLKLPEALRNRLNTVPIHPPPPLPTGQRSAVTVSETGRHLTLTDRDLRSGHVTVNHDGEINMLSQTNARWLLLAALNLGGSYATRVTTQQHYPLFAEHFAIPLCGADLVIRRDLLTGTGLPYGNLPVPASTAEVFLGPASAALLRACQSGTASTRSAASLLRLTLLNCARAPHHLSGVRAAAHAWSAGMPHCPHLHETRGPAELIPARTIEAVQSTLQEHPQLLSEELHALSRSANPRDMQVAALLKLTRRGPW